MNYQLKIQGLNKEYVHKKQKIHALKNIDLTIPHHRIVGLIGPNGAGKTTLLKTIAGQLFPTEGTLTVANRNIHKTPDSYEVCLVNDYEPLYTLHRIHTLLDIARLHFPDWDDDYAMDLLEIFQLNASKKYNQLSKGQRGLVSIIIALASKAPITMFDETHISLDVIMRQKFFDLLLEEYTDTRRTFIISTHYMNEASNLFEDVIMMNDGEILLHEEKDILDHKIWTITGDSSIGRSLLEKDCILKENTFGKTTEFHYYGTLSENVKAALTGYDFHITRSSLETFFLNTIHKEATNEQHQ